MRFQARMLIELWEKVRGYNRWVETPASVCAAKVQQSGVISSDETLKLNRRVEENLASYIPRLGSTPLEFQPGSRWAYSPQAGFDTLGRIVEIASGMPLNQFFRERIFNPLGMAEISFWPAADRWQRVASVYIKTPNGLQKNQNPNTMSSEVYFMGSGGLMTTAADYLPFGVRVFWRCVRSASLG